MFLGSCSKPTKVKPIEQYLDKKLVIVDIRPSGFSDVNYLRVKNSDSIFYIALLKFDIGSYNLKIGDTIK